MKIFTTQDIRKIDNYTIEQEKVDSLELIERVAEAVTCEIISRWRSNRPMAIFAGSGNNGADALAVARLLIEQGYSPQVFLFNIGGNKLSKECIAERNLLLQYSNVDFTEIISNFSLPDLSERYVVIDGLFGSGLKEPLTGGFKSLVQYINESGATIVAIDVPSGLFGDWNPGCINRNIIHADLTLAIQFPRLSFFIDEHAELVGEWKLIDIELSEKCISETPSNFYLVEEKDAKRALLHRSDFTSKKDYGSALLVAGSYGMMGAAILSAKGALRSGVGKLAIHSPRCAYSVLQTAIPEAIYSEDQNNLMLSDVKIRHNYSAIAIGPGIGTDEKTIDALENFLRSADKPLILDADALNCIALRPALLNYIPVLSIITPHVGEFDRLFGEHSSGEERLQKAIEMARYYNILIILKGHYTAIVRPDGLVYFNSSGNAAMATAGSGDVLTGVLVSLMAQGYKPEIASYLGVYIHGVAGDIAAEIQGQYGVIASDIANNVGKAIKLLMK